MRMKRACATTSSFLTSGWCCSTSLRCAFLISFSLAVWGTPSVAQGSFREQATCGVAASGGGACVSRRAWPAAGRSLPRLPPSAAARGSGLP